MVLASTLYTVLSPWSVLVVLQEINAKEASRTTKWRQNQAPCGLNVNLASFNESAKLGNAIPCRFEQWPSERVYYLRHRKVSSLAA